MGIASALGSAVVTLRALGVAPAPRWSERTLDAPRPERAGGAAAAERSGGHVDGASRDAPPERHAAPHPGAGKETFSSDAGFRGVAKPTPARRRPLERSERLQALSDDEVLDRYFAAADAEDRGVWVQELFRRHYPKVVSWCLRFAGNRDEAYDVAQAIFAKAYRHLGSFRRDAKITTWLYAITRSECMNLVRARKDRRDEVDAELEEVVDEDQPGPHEVLERQASARWVTAFLDRVLDETEKRVFTLHFGDEVPLDAITRLLGLSNRSGAKAYIVSARRKLARALRSSKTQDEARET